MEAPDDVPLETGPPNVVVGGGEEMEWRLDPLRPL